MTIVSVIGRKGGIAKTTTAANLAAALAMAGANVLAVDADSQGHLAVALGLERLPLFSRWAGGGPLLSQLCAALPAAATGCLALVSGGNESLGLSLDAAGVQALAARLREDAAALAADWVVIDSPASGPLQDFALLAADLIIIPAPCHFLGASGAVDAAALAQRVAPGTYVLALPTMYARRERDSLHWLRALEGHFANLLPAIPHRVAVAESLAVGVPLVAYKPAHDAAVAYRLAAEGVQQAAALLRTAVA